MRIVLLSDIHANLPALEAVLESLIGQEWDAMLVAGDIVGYYFWPRQVTDLLESQSAQWVRGNHEDMLISLRKGFLDRESTRKKFGPGLEIALTELAPEQLDKIEESPHPLLFKTPEGDLLLCHGAPTDINRYVYPDADIDELGRDLSQNCRWVVMGHTHHPMNLVGRGVRYINPGSVGQPRNRVPGAHWALLDTKDDQVDFFATDFDYTYVAAMARRECPNVPYLADVMGRQ